MAKASEAQCVTPRRDPYEVLGVPKDAKDDQIKSAYRKLALKYHPDKNADNPQASERFKEVAYAYSILVDPDKRRQYDAAGFAAVDSDDMELDLSSLSTVHTVVAALFSKLGVPIKTLVAPQVMEEAMMGAVHPRPLPLFKPVSDKVEKQGAHFYDVTITPEQAKGGIAIRVVSSTASKFKLLYFEQDASGGLSLALQEDSAKCGKLTAAGLYFLNFQVYRLDPLVNAMAVVKDPESALFKRLDGLEPTEMISLEGGNHIFAVYGDNFFKSATYTIEAVAVAMNADAKEKLKEVEAEILKKRDELKAFESEYKEAVTKYAAAQSRYAKEKQALDEVLSRREKVYEQFSSSVGLTGAAANGGTSPREGTGSGPTSPQAEPPGKGHSSGHSTKKKWWSVPTKSTGKGE